MGPRLEQLTAGQPIVFGGDRVTRVPEALAAAFVPGDRLLVVQETGDLLHVPATAQAAAADAVTAAASAFGALGRCTDEQITEFFECFADRLADDTTGTPILEANGRDVAAARAAGRATTRLVLTDKMRADMVAGLRSWADSPLRRDEPIERVDHETWSVEARRAPLGIVGFVFEGRPNVFADAAGVLRTGNAVVMRIGSDALRTAEAITANALEPALAAAGLPPGAVSLVRSPDRAAGWALFDDRRLALAVARGSGQAVAQLGAVARQAGTPVSLHGTGGAWLIAGQSADPSRLHASVLHSLDRKVCNTLNVCCLPSDRPDLVAVFLEALDEAAARRGTKATLHVERSSSGALPPERITTEIDRDDLGTEWEWEDAPEVSLVVTSSVDDAIDAFNTFSPRLAASLVSEDREEHRRFYDMVEAPFVGDGFTRWVDGQYALGTPELGLSNWQGGRLLGRGAVLSGDSVFTIRHRARIADPDLHR